MKQNNIKLLYIDLFCGAGGTSTGVEKSTQAEQKKFIGNAVEVNTSRALCEATFLGLLSQNIITLKQSA